MAEFFERLGHKIIISPSAVWYDIQPRVLLSFPFNRIIQPPQDEIDALMRNYSAKALRYSTALNEFGFFSNIVINTNVDYDLVHQHQKARNQTRRGLENNKVEPIDFEYLIEHGLPLNEDTAIRQGRESQYADSVYWRKYCLAAKDVPGVSAWGAFVEGHLAAFLIAVECDNWVEWIVNHSSTNLRDKYPNNALVFCAAQYFFREKKCKGICYGLGSLEETHELDHFKQRMGWELKPVKQRLVFSSKFKMVANWTPQWALQGAKLIFPKSYTVRKASAMIQHYREQTSSVPEITASSANQG